MSNEATHLPIESVDGAVYEFLGQLVVLRARVLFAAPRGPHLFVFLFVEPRGYDRLAFLSRISESGLSGSQSTHDYVATVALSHLNIGAGQLSKQLVFLGLGGLKVVGVVRYPGEHLSVVPMLSRQRLNSFGKSNDSNDSNDSNNGKLKQKMFKWQTVTYSEPDRTKLYVSIQPSMRIRSSGRSSGRSGVPSNG